MATSPAPKIPGLQPNILGQWQPPSNGGSRSGGLLDRIANKLVQWLYSPPATGNREVEKRRPKPINAVVLKEEIPAKSEKKGSLKAGNQSALTQGAKKLGFSTARLPLIHPLGRIGTYMCANGGKIPLSMSKGVFENMRIAYEGLGAGLGSGVIKCATQVAVVSAGGVLLGIEEEDNPKKREELKCRVTIASGLLSEAASAPANYMKTLQNISKEKQSCLQIIRRNGIVHMMNPVNNGTGPMLARNFFWILPFAYLRKNLNTHIKGGKVAQYAIAAFSGGAACVVSYPMESIRILHSQNLQTWVEAGKNGSKPSYLTTIKNLTAGKNVMQVAKSLSSGMRLAVAVMAAQGFFVAGLADWKDKG